ncbi:MAG: MepB family protein [Alcaligenes sp.]
MAGSTCHCRAFAFKRHSPQSEAGSSEYGAFGFGLDSHTIVFQVAKTTPTKLGQFIFSQKILLEKGLVHLAPVPRAVQSTIVRFTSLTFFDPGARRRIFTQYLETPPAKPAHHSTTPRHQTPPRQTRPPVASKCEP